MAKLLNEGEHNVLEVYLKGQARGDLYLGLYTDVAEPPEATALAAIGELPEGVEGYDRINLADGDWTVVADLATNVQKAFTAAGGDWAPIYGYFICDIITGVVGNLLFAEHFSDGPYTVLNGLSVLITPAIQAA
jgi:hypothetical protein